MNVISATNTNERRKITNQTNSKTIITTKQMITNTNEIANLFADNV